ncbi:hypothetical protein ACU8KH_01079 [Lachancea thermotolerans]
MSVNDSFGNIVLALYGFELSISVLYTTIQDLQSIDPSMLVSTFLS